MKKIIIIGAGFGGLEVARILSKRRGDVEVTVIDKKETSDFLPTMPDCIGRGIRPQYLSYPIKTLAAKFHFSFIKGEVSEIDLQKKSISTLTSTLTYDFLIIASGSETNFYGNEDRKRNAYKLDDVNDVEKLLETVKNCAFDNYIIGGGGYTGVEVATNLRLALNRMKKPGRITIVERAADILGPLPAWMKGYVKDNFKRLGIEVSVNSAVEKIDYDKTLLIWTAGVKTPAFIQNLQAEKNPQGRIKVDEYSRLNESCFVIGDAAYFEYKRNYLRMAVQFAIFQGRAAGKNIIRSIKGKGLKEFKPVDLGYIIPMANNHSCGTVFGLNLKGILPTMLHFVMCIYRSYGLKNRFGIIKDLLTGGEKWRI
ncbi:MAG: FAD-dependent oxidoreductase [Candidatus Omnitrophica bacterium]|nr:FAD-dependent oxidoreductase [Candidatus Omnitrophota bacterium]